MNQTTYLLCRKCSCADSGSVGFDDAVDITNSSRRNSETSQDATNRTVARRYKTESNTDISFQCFLFRFCTHMTSSLSTYDD